MLFPTIKEKVYHRNTFLKLGQFIWKNLLSEGDTTVDYRLKLSVCDYTHKKE